jgi:hypothetical protein
MTIDRVGSTATLLNNGKVLIAGGYGEGNWASAELYDPATGTFSATGSMTTIRFYHAAALLNNGKVLIMGGSNDSNELASAEIYDPATGTFTATGSMNEPRENFTATLLNNGMVLASGGSGGPDAELYDPATGSFALTGDMTVSRSYQTATLLNDGKVLVAGGSSSPFSYLASAELYDPSAGTFTATGSMAFARGYQTATLLNNGTVLVSGGEGTSTSLSSAELYDPATGAFTSASNMFNQRSVDTATRLNNGNVLVAGGANASPTFAVLASAELYPPSTQTPPGLVSIAITPGNPSISVGDTQAFIAAGTFNDSSTQQLASVTWSSSNGAVATISNDASNHGNSFGAGAGLATITACAGPICGSTNLTVNPAPIITSLSTATFVTGIAGTFTVTAKGVPAPTFTESGALPSGVTFNNSTGVLSGTPAAGTAGTYPITFTALNGVTPNATQSFTLTVAQSIAPQFSSAPNAKFEIGMSGSFTVTATGIPAPTLSVSSGMLPSGVTFNPTTGALVGLPPAAGTSGIYAVTFTAQNGVLTNATQNFTLAIDEVPQITSAATTLFSEQSAGSFTVTATGFPPPTLTESGTLPSGITFNASTGVLGGTAAFATAGTYPITFTAQNGQDTDSVQNFTLSVTQWFPAGNMTDGRQSHTATLLNNGKILVTGGFDGATYLSSAELFDPVTRTFTATGSMTTARVDHTAALLNNGKVLIAGGFGGSGDSPLASAELYDPATGIFTATGSMTNARFDHTATLLQDGKVLVAGGDVITQIATADAEIYDPATGTFTPTGNMTDARFDHTATLLNNGKVLVTGGLNANSNGVATATAELYDPVSGTFTTTASMSSPRETHVATLLNDGNVLVTGGGAIAADLYNSASGIFTTTGSMTSSRSDHTATLLNNGQVLVAGGYGFSSVLTSAELYDPVAGTFTATSNMINPHAYGTATLLDNGSVLVSGLFGGSPLGTTADIYPPRTLTPPGLVSIQVTPGNASISVSDTPTFIATGTFSDNSTQQLASVTWSSSNAGIATVTNDLSNHGTAFAVSTGSATITACAGSVCGSTTLTVSAAP